MEKTFSLKRHSPLTKVARVEMAEQGTEKSKLGNLEKKLRSNFHSIKLTILKQTCRWALSPFTERACHPYLIAGYFYHPKETPQQYPHAPASSPATSDLLPVCGVACCGRFIRVEARGALPLYVHQSFIPLYGQMASRLSV